MQVLLSKFQCDGKSFENDQREYTSSAARAQPREYYFEDRASHEVCVRENKEHVHRHKASAPGQGMSAFIHPSSSPVPNEMGDRHGFKDEDHKQTQTV